MNRRHFLAQLGATAAFAAVPAVLRASAPRPVGRAPRILLRGAWQTTNIGDIGHTPGVLALLERHFPEAEVTLWPGGVGHGAREFLLRHFPRLRIVEDQEAIRTLKPTTDALRAAWAEADFMLHSSGSGLGGRAHVAAWHRATGKPYGFFGVSADPISGFGDGRDPEGGTLADLRQRIAALPATHLDAETRWLLDGAAFVFARDTLTLDYLRAQGVRSPVLEFGPDAQFAMPQRDEAKGDAYRAAHGLESGRFLCVIPRSRYTPYWEVYNRPKNPTEDVREAINQRTSEADNGKLREMIVSYVRNTGHRVMTCPEMTYQIGVAKEFLIDPLPADVKPHVVWRDTYWLPDEAAAIYAHAQAVVSMDCHSPIIAVAQGTPGFYVRQPTDTCKGQMYHDVGLGDWIFEVEETSGAVLWQRLETVIRRPQEARNHLEAAMTRVRDRQTRMTKVLKRAAVAT